MQKLTKFRMANDAILDFEKLLSFLYYLTSHHQIWWNSCDFHLLRENVKVIGIYDCGCRHIRFRIISFAFD